MKESVKLIDQGQCEKCESLAHELAEVKRENEQLRTIMRDKSLEAMRIAAFNTSHASKVAARAKSDEDLRYAKTQLVANDRLFAQHQALVESPLKTEQMKAKTENIKARTALAETDRRLKEEKIKDSQADRFLKSLVLELLAEKGNMVDADVVVLDQFVRLLKQSGVKIPVLLAKNLKKT